MTTIQMVELEETVTSLIESFYFHLLLLYCLNHIFAPFVFDS